MCLPGGLFLFHLKYCCQPAPEQILFQYQPSFAKANLLGCFFKGATLGWTWHPDRWYFRTIAYCNTGRGGVVFRTAECVPVSPLRWCTEWWLHCPWCHLCLLSHLEVTGTRDCWTSIYFYVIFKYFCISIQPFRCQGILYSGWLTTLEITDHYKTMFSKKIQQMKHNAKSIIFLVESKLFPKIKVSSYFCSPWPSKHHFDAS